MEECLEELLRIPVLKGNRFVTTSSLPRHSIVVGEFPEFGFDIFDHGLDGAQGKIIDAVPRCSGAQALEVNNSMSLSSVESTEFQEVQGTLLLSLFR